MYKSITEKDGKQDRLTKFMQAELRRRDEEALRSLLKSKEGRWFLMRLFDLTKVTQSCFTGNSHTFYNEGKRDVGLAVMRDIAALGLDGIKFKQKAELEYIETQYKAQEIAKDYLKEESD